MENLDPDEEENDGHANDDFNPWALPRFDTEDASIYASIGVKGSGCPPAQEVEWQGLDTGDSLAKQGSDDRGFGLNAYKHQTQGKVGAASHDFAQEFSGLASAEIQALGAGSVVEEVGMEVEGRSRDGAMPMSLEEHTQ